MELPAITALHRRRLRDIYRSAGWPCQDAVEIELLAAGCVERVRDALGRDTLRVTDHGIALLAATLQHNRALRDAHEALVAQVALAMQRAGRIVWRGLALRAICAARPRAAPMPRWPASAGMCWPTASPTPTRCRRATA